MILRSLTLLSLALPNVLFYTWLATEFVSFGEIVNDGLARTLFLEMMSASLLVSYIFWANPLGSISVKWFLLMSVVAGVGIAVPVFYWLNKNGVKAARGLREKRRRFNRERRERKRARPSLILRGQSV